MFLNSRLRYLYRHAVSVCECVFVLLELRSFYDQMKYFSNYGICGLLGETHFATFHDKYTVVVTMKRAWKIEEAEEF